MHHNLKIEEPYLQAIIDGKKNFEIRNNDRGYQSGDTVTLTHNLIMPKINATIGYVTPFLQKDGFVVFSLINIEVIKD